MDKFLGDCLDKEIESYSMCMECTRRSRGCTDCKFHNSQRSIKEIQEMATLWETMTIIQNPLFPQNNEMKVIMCHYPLDGPVNELYPPSASNSLQYKSATKSLVRKLKKKGLLEDFHAQMVKSVKEDHCVMLSKEEAKEMLKKNHCFSCINYARKAGSISHKLRLVTNSSSNHVNGSLNTVESTAICQKV